MSGTRKLDDAQREAILKLRAADPKRWTYRELGAAFGVSDSQAQRVVKPEFAYKTERIVPCETYHRGYYHRVEADALKLAREIPKDSRDITGRINGDPLPGRSALDRRRGRAG